MARRLVVAVALWALSAALFAQSAPAHAGNPNMESVVLAVTPALPGFAVEVLNRDDRLEVVNAGPRTVTIDGYDGEPYVRMRPDGHVAVNVRSPAYYLNEHRYGAVDVPRSASKAAAPRWRTVARNGRYEFHDHRIHWMTTATPPQVTDTAKRTKVLDWSVPLRADGAPAAIRGRLWWRGSAGGAPIVAFVALGAFVVLALAGAALVRRRRRGGGTARGGARDAGEAW